MWVLDDNVTGRAPTVINVAAQDTKLNTTTLGQTYK